MCVWGGGVGGLLLQFFGKSDYQLGICVPVISAKLNIYVYKIE